MKKCSGLCVVSYHREYTMYWVLTFLIIVCYSVNMFAQGAMPVGCWRSNQASAPHAFRTANRTIGIRPHEFESDMTCEWIISVGMEKVIFMQFKHLNLGFGSSQLCANSENYLSVYDGRNESAALLNTYCLSLSFGLPCPIYTSGNEAFIRMRGRYKFDGVGFSLIYNETKEFNRTDDPRNCTWTNTACTAERPFHLNKSFGVVESPTFYLNRIYPPNANCTWKITAPENQVIIFTFEYVDLDYLSSTESQDCLSIYDNGGTLLAEFCSGLFDDSICPVQTSGNEALVNFITNAQNELTGFRLRYAAVSPDHRYVPESSNHYIIYENEDCDEGVDLEPHIQASGNADNCIERCEGRNDCTGFVLGNNYCYLKDASCEDTPKYLVGTDTYLNKGCKWTGSACTAGRPQVMRELNGGIDSPTMFDTGEYPPDVHCVWQIIVPQWMIVTIRVVRAEIGFNDILTIFDGDMTTTAAQLLDRQNTDEKLFHRIFNSTGSTVSVVFTSSDNEHNTGTGFYIRYRAMHGPTEKFILNTDGKTYTLENNSDDCQTKGGHVMVANYEEEWAQLVKQLDWYMWRNGIVEFEEHHIGGHTKLEGKVEEYDEYFPKEAIDVTDFCVILKADRSDAFSNVTLDVYGVDCHSVQHIPVICEKNEVNISINTNTRLEDILTMSDNNESTCLDVTRQNVTLSLVTELRVIVPAESVPDEYFVIKILMNGLKCNTSVVFYKVGEITSNCVKKKTQEEVGQLLSAVPNSNTNACYYQLPIECEGSGDWCEFDGVLAVSNPNGESVEVCEINQG